MNTSLMTESDWAAILDEAASPSKAKPPLPPPAPLKTADDIVAEEQAKAATHLAPPTFGDVATLPRASGTPSQTTPATGGSGIVFADDVPTAPVPEAPTTPTLAAILEELRGIHAELRSMGGMLAVGVNKLPQRR